jgi:Skp family chaperone for outer membrane proteins
MRRFVFLIAVAFLPALSAAQSALKSEIITKMNEIAVAMQASRDDVVSSKTEELRAKVRELLARKWPFAPRRHKLADLVDALTYAERYMTVQHLIF